MHFGLRLPEDLDEVFDHFQQKFGASGVYVLAFSHGAFELQHYLTMSSNSSGRKCHKLVKGGIAVSSPHDIETQIKKIEGSSKAIHSGSVENLKDFILKLLDNGVLGEAG